MVRRLQVSPVISTVPLGSPKFVMNNGTEIGSTGKDAGITNLLSWLKAWPNLEVRFAYKIF